MLELARARVPTAEFVGADVPPLPFPDDSFDLALSSNVYSHIETAAARLEFVAEVLRVAPTLVVLEQGWRSGRERESWELRRLRDGSEHRVFKRYFTADALARELGGTVVLASPEFLAVRAPAERRFPIGVPIRGTVSHLRRPQAHANALHHGLASRWCGGNGRTCVEVPAGQLGAPRSTHAKAPTSFTCPTWSSLTIQSR
jgi:SAM-dependent methyltransferase